MEPTALPTYRCHKRVQAVKIKEVSLHDPAGSDPPVEFSGGFIIHDLPSPGPIAFDADFWNKHKPRAGDYLVIYEDGYRSISPGKAFEDGYTLEGPGLNFGQSIEALKKGCRVARKGWNGKCMFIFLQVPASIPADIIPKMQSLPESVKAEFATRGGFIHYSNQIVLVKPNNNINGWSPSAADALAEDWEILDATSPDSRGMHAADGD
jgi:hypothetical protein